MIYKLVQSGILYCYRGLHFEHFKHDVDFLVCFVVFSRFYNYLPQGDVCDIIIIFVIFGDSRLKLKLQFK